MSTGAIIAIVIAAIVIGTAVGTKTIDQNNNNSAGPSQRADHILKQAGFSQAGPLTEIAVIRPAGMEANHPSRTTRPPTPIRRGLLASQPAIPSMTR